MPKAQADQSPEKFVKSHGKTQFNFNIVETTRENDDGTTTPIWEYDYVAVEKTDRTTLIRAMMSDKYSVGDELALINNKFKGDQKGNSEYAQYQTYRQNIKTFVDQAEGLN